MDDAVLVELLVDGEVLHQLLLRKHVQDPTVYQLNVEHLTELTEPQADEPLTRNPLVVQLWGIDELAGISNSKYVYLW